MGPLFCPQTFRRFSCPAKCLLSDDCASRRRSLAAVPQTNVRLPAPPLTLFGTCVPQIHCLTSCLKRSFCRSSWLHSLFFLPRSPRRRTRKGRRCRNG